MLRDVRSGEVVEAIEFPAALLGTHEVLVPPEDDFKILSLATIKSSSQDNSVTQWYSLQRLIGEILRQSESVITYLHGTRSTAIPGIIKAGGLKPLGEQQTLGIETKTGENRAGALGKDAPNQWLLSAVSGRHPWVAVQYACRNLSELISNPDQLELALALAHEHFPHLEALSTMLENSFKKHERIKGEESFPVIIGITNTEGSIPDVSLKQRGERHLPPVDIERLIFFVPPEKVEEVRNKFRNASLEVSVDSIFNMGRYNTVQTKDDIDLETAYRLILDATQNVR